MNDWLSAFLAALASHIHFFLWRYRFLLWYWGEDFFHDGKIKYECHIYVKKENKIGRGLEGGFSLGRISTMPIINITCAYVHTCKDKLKYMYCIPNIFMPGSINHEVYKIFWLSIKTTHHYYKTHHPSWYAPRTGETTKNFKKILEFCKTISDQYSILFFIWGGLKVVIRTYQLGWTTPTVRTGCQKCRLDVEGRETARSSGPPPWSPRPHQLLTPPPPSQIACA